MVPLFLSSCDTAPSIALHYDRTRILRNTFPIATIISMPIQFADVHIYMTYVKVSSNSTCKVEPSQLHVIHSHHKPVNLPLSPRYQHRSTVGLQAQWILLECEFFANSSYSQFQSTYSQGGNHTSTDFQSVQSLLNATSSISKTTQPT